MSGISKQIWLLLYAEGGWWSVAEVRRTLTLAERTAGALPQTLEYMKTAGFLESKDEPDYQLERRLRYGVTRRCKVPRGVKLEEIEATLTMGMELKAA